MKVQLSPEASPQPDGRRHGAGRVGQFAGILACAGLLLWPAWLNGYPLFFSDIGTYLSQAIRYYLGWDRPAIYSVFLLVTHWKLTIWTSIIVQALMVLYVLDAVRRAFAPDVPRSAADRGTVLPADAAAVVCKPGHA